MESEHLQRIGMDKQAIALREIRSNSLIRGKSIAGQLVKEAIFTTQLILVDGIQEYNMTKCFANSPIPVLEQTVTRQGLSLVA